MTSRSTDAVTKIIRVGNESRSSFVVVVDYGAVAPCGGLQKAGVGNALDYRAPMQQRAVLECFWPSACLRITYVLVFRHAVRSSHTELPRLPTTLYQQKSQATTWHQSDDCG